MSFKMFDSNNNESMGLEDVTVKFVTMEYMRDRLFKISEFSHMDTDTILSSLINREYYRLKDLDLFG